MKYLNRLFLLVLFAHLWLLAQPLNAQEKYTLAPDPDLKITGTSTLHDWDMTSNTASGEAVIKIENGNLKEINSMRVTMPAESLKSSRGQMDRNAYKALETNKHPTIIFELLQVQGISEGNVKAKGNMTVAGSTQPVILQANYSLSGNTVQFSGLTPIKFSDFNIDPPTAVLGTIRTGDDLHFHFEVNFTPEN